MKIFSKYYRRANTHKPQEIKNLLGQTIAIVGECGFVFYDQNSECHQPCSHPDTCPFYSGQNEKLIKKGWLKE